MIYLETATKKLSFQDLTLFLPYFFRMGPWGWMFNIAGLDAVEIEYKGGKFRIGTDEAEELAKVIIAATRNTWRVIGRGAVIAP